MKNKKKIIGSTAILILFLCFMIIGYFKDNVYNEKTEDIFIENKEEFQDSDITIYVNGEVINPGVYKLKGDSRIEDVIKIAGGFTNNADKDKLNLAKKLRDEDYIFVYERASENNDGSKRSNNINQEKKVNINEASKEELKSIPGIGEVTAQKIIEYRETNRGFNSIDEMKNIDRIGEKTFEKLKDKLDIR
ncbi:helix-hairpin-helix domain-containing protein [uncultured Clostridium sp.]|uniref:helix-hairpin-helix domain-containing protein n=1 Tax=uncultured Clostridium sp. TaxID=59620 RepID=UPI0028E21E4C|nr:helix-hairpin-helix domain-containing protein [uncultured Clostridium sp.]